MKIISIILALFITGHTKAQSQSSADSLLTGTWKGTSICQVKPSACNDEIAVYHISKTKRPNLYHIVANKVIDGKEEDMSVDDFTWDAVAGTLYCNIPQYNVEIKLSVKDKTIQGQLLSKNIVSRIIKLEKASQ